MISAALLPGAGAAASQCLRRDAQAASRIGQRLSPPPLRHTGVRRLGPEEELIRTRRPSVSSSASSSSSSSSSRRGLPLRRMLASLEAAGVSTRGLLERADVEAQFTLLPASAQREAAEAAEHASPSSSSSAASSSPRPAAAPPPPPPPQSGDAGPGGSGGPRADDQGGDSGWAAGWAAAQAAPARAWASASAALSDQRERLLSGEIQAALSNWARTYDSMYSISGRLAVLGEKTGITSFAKRYGPSIMSVVLGPASTLLFAYLLITGAREEGEERGKLTGLARVPVVFIRSPQSLARPRTCTPPFLFLSSCTQFGPLAPPPPCPGFLFKAAAFAAAVCIVFNLLFPSVLQDYMRAITAAAAERARAAAAARGAAGGGPYGPGGPFGAGGFYGPGGRGPAGFGPRAGPGPGMMDQQPTGGGRKDYGGEGEGVVVDVITVNPPKPR